jgi:hypothetical protein
LLKTQLANESAWRMPVGCHWQSTHPLKERVAMLKYPSPGRARRLSGIAVALALTLVGSYAVWAFQPDALVPAVPGASARLIAVKMKWWINGADILESRVASQARDIRVVSGAEFVRKVSLGMGKSYETRCFASLSNEDRQSSIWETAKSSGQRVDGLILLECKLSNEGHVFSTPAILLGDGQAGTIEVTTQDGAVHHKVEFIASSQASGSVAST